MQACPSCGESNLAAAERCSKCGVWFPRGVDGSPTESPPPKQPATRELPPAVTFEGRVLRLLQRGQKIPAIKLYREQTGAGLKEAKDAVEAMGRRYGLNVGGTGCAGTAVVACVIAWTLCVCVRHLIFG